MTKLSASFATLFGQFWRKPRGPLPDSERDARRTMPANMRRYFDECAEAERLRDLDADIDRGIALRRAEREKHAAAAHKGIERAKGRM
jgi:hypothetical protein